MHVAVVDMDETYGAYVAAEKNTFKITYSESKVNVKNDKDNKVNHSNSTASNINGNSNNSNNDTAVPVHTGSGSYRFGF